MKYLVTLGFDLTDLGSILKNVIILATREGIDDALLAAGKVSGGFLLDANNKLTASLAKIGLDTTKLGVNGLRMINVGIGAAGAVIDVYTIVDAWTSTPKVVSHMNDMVAILLTHTLYIRDFEIGVLEKGNSAVWVKSEKGVTLENAFVAGEDKGKSVHVIRAFHNGNVVPGKLVAGDKAEISYAGKRHVKTKYQVRFQNIFLQLRFVKLQINYKYAMHCRF